MFSQFTKKTEKLVRSLYNKKFRLVHNLCVCEGIRACKELYSSNPDFIEFGISSNNIDISFFKGIKFFVEEISVLDRISATINTQGIILIARIPVPVSLNEMKSPFALVLDRLADPGNFGTILRTCAAVGLRDVWYSSGSVDPYSEKTIRAALSAQFSLYMHQYENIDTLISELKMLGYDKVFRTEPARGINIFTEKKLFEKSIIIFGNEANGIKDINTSIPVNIPMPGKFESLNVAQAVSVILFEGVRRGIFN